MTIDEAIAYERTKADKARESEALFLRDDLIWNAKEEHRLAEEHEQIAEWLEELKARREADRTSDSKPFDVLLEQRYNKAIDDFLEKIQWEYLNGCGIKQREIEFLVAVSSQVAERLKAGGENEQSI